MRELSLFPFYVRQRVRSLEPECLHFLPKDTACNCSTLGKLLKLQSLLTLLGSEDTGPPSLLARVQQKYELWLLLS